MDKIIIIGGGFSAFLAKLALGKTATIINTSGNNNLKSHGIKRQKNLDSNKFFVSKSRSFGSLKPEFNRLKLHDRLSHGGNSNIWGGIIDTGMLNKNMISRLEENDIILQPLSFSKTGNVSNNKALAQLQSKDKKILDLKSFFEKEKDNYLESFFIENNQIGLNIISLDGSPKKKVIYAKKLVICTGVFQTIDLLYRSGFIGNDDSIGLSEFGYKRSVSFTFDPQKFYPIEDEVVVRFEVLRAACHFLGIQRRLWLSNLFSLLPIYINQIFYNTETEYLLKINDDKLIELYKPGVFNKTAYGKSIHYSNLLINQISINDFISDISPQIIGLGMAFVRQLKPGPISNDIILDAYKKMNNF